MWILYSVLGILLVLIVVLVVRTSKFVPLEGYQKGDDLPSVDEKRLIESLQAMIRFKTVSYREKEKVDRAEFQGFRDYLKTRYPKIFEIAKYREIGESGMLFHLKGKSSEKPVVLMSHYDVVPPNGTWKHGAFSGDIIDEKVYGRGTLDTKATLCCVMESVEKLLSEKFTFHSDFYLAFSGDEEIRGPSADAIVQVLKEEGVRPYLVLDEGGAVVQDIFPGVKKESAVVGLAEKGGLNLKITAKAQGGHASTPANDMPVSDLGRAIHDLHKGQLFKMKKTEATSRMFDQVARYSDSFMIRMIFANLWLFFPLVKMLAKKQGGQLASLLRTTQAFTVMEASDAYNVLPSEASIGINYRLLTGETVEATLAKIKKRIGQYDFDYEVIYGAGPTEISKVDGSYELVKKTIHEIFGDVAVVPYLMMAGTDSRYYHAISEHVYRFSPMHMSKEELATIHSTEEAIRIEELVKCHQFYVQLIKNVV